MLKSELSPMVVFGLELEC